MMSSEVGRAHGELQGTRRARSMDGVLRDHAGCCLLLWAVEHTFARIYVGEVLTAAQHPR